MPADSRFDLIQAIVVALFGALGGAAAPLMAMDHWQRVLGGAFSCAAAAFSGSMIHDAIVNRPTAPAAAPAVKE